ncbi:MAG: type III secretion system protein SctP [Pararobbsia sp.]
MHSSAPHRARVIAGHVSHREPEPTPPSAQLRRQIERFRLLRAGVDPDADPAGETPAQDATPETPREPDALAGLAEPRDESHGDRDDREGDGRGDDDARDARDTHDAESAESQPDSAPEAGIPVFMPHFAHIGAVHHAGLSNRPGTHAAAVDAPARTGQDVHRLIESIVAQVADFCSNPAVLERGDWRITIPIDSAQLPDCTLSLALSRFDLMLRFDTSDHRSRQVVLQHATTLRDSLEQVMQTRFDTSRSIEINVT